MAALKPLIRARSLSRVVTCGVAALAAVFALRAAAAEQPQASESSVKAAFVYKFASFVEWPSTALPQPAQPFVIGVSGNEQVAADLEQIVAGRTLNGSPVAVRRLPDAATGATAGVHVLFISARREERLREAIQSAEGAVLVVTEQPGALRLGSVLNMVPEDGRVRFSASVASASARGLKLSSRLLAVAQAVEGATP